MTLPSLATLLPKRREEKELEQFLALELGERVVKAAIWEENGQVVIKALAKADTVEEAIRRVKEKFEGELKIKKVIFGLPPRYVHEDKIKEEYLKRLKEITKKFSLAPLGFVVIPEAIAHLLEVEEETPQTAILIALGKKRLLFSLFRGGQCQKTEEVKRTEKIYSDLEEGLAKFAKEEVLPSKIILYDEGEELAEIKEELLSYPWEKNERFLHVPKIETLPWDFSLKAVVEAGVSEIKKKDVHLVVEEGEEESAEALGFVKDKDIASKEKEEGEEAKEEQPRQKFKFSQLPQFTWPQISLPPVFTFSLNFLKVKGFFFLFIFLILFGGVALSSFYFYPQAKINLIADPKILEKKIEVTLNTGIESPDISAKEIPGKVSSIQVLGEKSKEVTGKKIIGEPARGEVTIYNKTTAAKTFKKGTVLFGPAKLRFTLDGEVTVASVSDVIAGTAGTAKAKVTAERIGPTGNLKVGSDFTIDNFPLTSYAARNEADFSGGTEREIAVVSSEDQEELVKQLTEELKKQAQEKLKSKLAQGEKFLAESLTENVVEKVFDKEVGEEADSLSLKLTLEFSQTSYRQSDLNKFLESYIAEQIPPSFELKGEKTQFRVLKSEQAEDGSVSFTADYRAFLLPKIELEKFKREIRGLSLSQLEEKVKALTEKNIIGYEIFRKRKLPFLGGRLPLWEKNIEVEVVPF